MSAPRLVALDGPLTAQDIWDRARRRKEPEPRGHAAMPGTGPEGETCGSCRHLARIRLANTYLKCALNEARWTGGRKSDVRAKDAACAKWQRREVG